MEELSMTAAAAALEPATRSDSEIVFDFTIPARAPWSHVVKKGQTIRIIDLEGNQAVDCIVYSAADPAERYSSCETIVAQRNIFLGVGTVLMSNEGNAMMTITADTCGRH